METYIKNIGFCFIFISLFTSVHGQPALKSRASSIADVMGAFTEVVNSFLFYESYVPVILKFRVPDWKVDNLRLRKTLKCGDDDLSSANDYLCPVAYHMEGLLTPLAQTMRFYKHINSFPSGSFYETNFSCDVIKPHFDHFSIPIGGLLPYISELRDRCSLGKNATITIKNVDTSTAQHAVMAFEKYMQLHENNIKDKNYNERKFLDMSIYAALQNMFVFYQYVDSFRWANAFTSCQSYKLDVRLVSPAMLNESLVEVSKIVYRNGYTFSLPFNSSLAHYYKLPLADCILTLSSTPRKSTKSTPLGPNSNSIPNLVVRLLIPVVKFGVTYQIVKLNKIPYIRREQDDLKICEIRNFNIEDGYLIENNLSSNSSLIVGKVPPSCLTNALCKVPKDTDQVQTVDLCVTGIITKNQTLTSKHCSFDCLSISGNLTSFETRFPIFTKISSNKYAVTGLLPGKLPLLYIRCGEQTKHLFNPSTDEGVIFVTLSCDCELSYGAKTFPVEQPCDDPIAVEHVMANKLNNQNAAMFQNEYHSKDYIVDSLKTEDFSLTFNEITTEKSGTDGVIYETTTASMTSEKSIDNPVSLRICPTDHCSSPQQQGLVHCGHTLIWIFLIAQLNINLFVFFILYKHGVIGFNSFYLW